MSETRSSRSTAIQNAPVDPELKSTKADEPPVDPEAAAEAEKAKRADAGVTGDPSGNPAGVAFSDRIADAKFALRNQGHSLIEGLLDDMLGALQRVETKLFGG